MGEKLLVWRVETPSDSCRIAADDGIWGHILLPLALVSCTEMEYISTYPCHNRASANRAASLYCAAR